MRNSKRMNKGKGESLTLKNSWIIYGHKNVHCFVLFYDRKIVFNYKQ